ncbi:DUF6270 domain-containing protein [Neobacillus sp. DY30]|uniref:DUF6270 domain-containing protein n=1 Tax=Neobacillus sp. DY30 TaxID=3047871 RepID=UPI0024BF3D32|nr:DUF6270 domain-containing protein [Neobacillus sp. DY30]WHY00435.1 DUF6270 domain-containing protein [Neobacillus sp. DY30]
MNIGIFGGCVSRDIFRLFPERDHVQHYSARTSLISQFSEPTKVDLNDINLSSAFQKRIVAADFNKTLKKDLESLDVDFFIIDFLVERISLLANGNKYITRSKELSNSGILNNKKYRLGKVVNRKADDMVLLHEWFNACDQFIASLQKNFKPNQIILNEVYLTEQYREQSEIKNFDEKQTEGIRETNSLLKMYYSYFKARYPSINCIQISKENNVGDLNHQWGLSPMHFVDDYYLEARQQLNKIYQENQVQTTTL